MKSFNNYIVEELNIPALDNVSTQIMDCDNDTVMITTSFVTV